MTRDDEKILVEQFLTALRAGADFRGRKVRRLRAAIRAGAFENRLKLEVASDRLAAELMGGEDAAAPAARSSTPARE
jgi:hypothetical protein